MMMMMMTTSGTSPVLLGTTPVFRLRTKHEETKRSGRMLVLVPVLVLVLVLV